MIEIVNARTHEFKHFASTQEIADFLHAREDAADWTGHEPHGALPAAGEEAQKAAQAPDTEPTEAQDAEVTAKPAAKAKRK